MFIEHHSTTAIEFEKRHTKTITAYEVRYRSINDYLILVNQVRVKCTDFNVKLARAYFKHLSARYSNNYAARHVDLCKKVLKYALNEEFIRYNPLSAFELKKTGPSPPVYLTDEELLKFERYQPKTKAQERVKLMFLFQCYVGIDYGDLMTIGPKDIITYKNRKFVVKKRNKTKIEACAPYTSQAEAIMEYFNGFIPKMRNRPYNKALQVIAERAGITKHITSHVGRKTCGMHMLNYRGYSMEATSKILGHKSIKTTETYYVTVEIDLVVKEMEAMERSMASLAIA